MRNFAVKLYGENNELNIPSEWPQESFNLEDDMVLPDGFFKMSEEEYNAHINKYRADYEEWSEKRNRPSLNALNRKIYGPQIPDICEALLEMVSSLPNLTPKMQAIIEHKIKIEKEYPID